MVLVCISTSNEGPTTTMVDQEKRTWNPAVILTDTNIIRLHEASGRITHTHTVSSELVFKEKTMKKHILFWVANRNYTCCYYGLESIYQLPGAQGVVVI